MHVFLHGTIFVYIDNGCYLIAVNFRMRFLLVYFCQGSKSYNVCAERRKKKKGKSNVIRKQPKILIAEDKDVSGGVIKNYLHNNGFAVLETPYKSVFHTYIKENNIDLVLFEFSCSTTNNVLTIVKRIRTLDKSLPIIMVTEDSSAENIIAALRIGIDDYFKHPVKKEDIIESIERCLSNKDAKKSSSRPAHQEAANKQKLIGISAAMESVRMNIKQMSKTDANVLITGETGTGKELVANLIHKNSSRAGKPFVCINCTAIPDHLLESELFGYEKGSFTGADALNAGKLQVADGGTVFLDEIGDMSLYHQAKILRTIESKEIQRVGGRHTIPLNIKIIAATNQDLEQMVAEGKFRKDLFYRLNVSNINLPSLRERKEDIPDLLHYFIGTLNNKYQKEIVGFTADTVKDLMHYNWPGNVREMKNILESSFMNFQTKWVTLTDLPENFRTKVIQSRILHYSEKDQLLNALVTTDWNKSKAAKQLNWSRMTVHRKVVKYQLHKMQNP